MVNFSVCCIYWRRLQDWCKNWTGFIWRTRPCGTEGFKTSQSSVNSWTSSSCGFLHSSTLLWGQNNLLLYKGSFTFREDCSSLWSRLCPLRHLSLHCGLQLSRFSTAACHLVKVNPLSFCLGFGTSAFYAQELNLVNWGWRSSLLQQVVIWPDCLDVWLKYHRPNTLSQVY